MSNIIVSSVPRTRHRSDSAEDRSKYVLSVDRVKNGEDLRTTLMIKNIPNKYNQKMLLAAVDEVHKGAYDFFYLPIDFKNKCNVGYAFINFVSCDHILAFYEQFNNKKWEKFNSEKVCEITYARIQGKQALIGHFQNSSLMCEDKKCRPIIFHTGGPNIGEQEPFPIGPNVRPRSSSIGNKDEVRISSE
jgi:RNA recognition motif-containing protein